MTLLETAQDNTAWHLFGLGVGQAQVIEFGLIVGTALVVGFRLLTRGKRYRRD